MSEPTVPPEASSDASGQLDSPARRVGRRALMLGAAAAGAGVAASLVVGADPANAETAATTSKAVLLSKSNTAKATTTVVTKAGNGLEGVTSADDCAGVAGDDTSANGGFGLYGTSTDGYGVYATSESGKGVYGQSTDSDGLHGQTSGDGACGAYGYDGSSGGGYGVNGQSTNGTGVIGQTTADGLSGVEGVDASSGGGYAVSGNSTNGIGVIGQTTGDGQYGVYGYDKSAGGGWGVFGYGNNGNGVVAENNTDSSEVWALLVSGTSYFGGHMSKPSGSFQIDHPLDPAAKYLYHSFVESPDMMNVYNGTVVLDDDGQVTVELPDWFEALNRDYRYSLTALDRPAPELHISRRVADGKFSIAGGNAGQEVSWQVTGIRQDAWANAHRVPVEVDKREEDQGRYLHPELFGGEAITALSKLHRYARQATEAAQSVSRRGAVG
jgi:hypothetical protein